jgi:hypothetical protein
MPQRVRPQLAYARCCLGLLVHAPYLVVGPRQPPKLIRRGKDPIFGLRKLGRLCPHLKDFEERSINGHLPPRLGAFDIVKPHREFGEGPIY